MNNNLQSHIARQVRASTLTSRRASRVAYYTIAADLDKNLNEEADGFECAELLLEEYASWQGEVPPLLLAPLFNGAYQTLKRTSSVDIVMPTPREAGALYRVRDGIPRGNDIMVTLESGAGRGPGGFKEQLDTKHGEFGRIRDHGRNHASVVNQYSAVQVIKWIQKVEQERGDLR